MSPLNKYEAVGIFVSVAIMAVALAILRFESNTFAGITETKGTDQVATVVATRDTEENALRENIENSVNAKGMLTDLVIDDVRIGSGVGAVVGDSVTVHYIGTLRDGTQFDSSYVRGEPFTFKIGEGKVIAGWEKGLVGMQAGGERILVVPPDMAYGNRQIGPIPPNSPLIFSIELLEIK